MELSLLSVTFALPIELRAIRHIYEVVNDFLKPVTYDSAVFHDLPRVIQVYGATRGLTVRAMDGAALRGRIDIVRWLLDNRTEGCSAAALTGAAMNGYIEVARLVWDSYMSRCHAGEALVSAAANGHEEVVEFLLDKCTMVMKALALVTAAANGHLPVVRVLPADDFGIGSGKAIREAASNGHVEVVAFFFERSELIRDVNAATVLEKAIHGGHNRLVQYVLDSADEKGWLFVHTLTCAVVTGRLDTVRLLIERANQSTLFRALVKSSRKGQTDAVELLVKACEQSSSDASSDDKLTYFDEALSNAAKENRAELVNIFVKKASPASVERVMIQATVCGFAQVVKVLLETGACGKWYIYHALIVASEHGCSEVVAILFETSTQVFSYNPPDCSGLDAIRSSLLKAVMYGHTEVVLQVLVKYESYSSEVAGEFHGVGDCLVQPIDSASIREAIETVGSRACPSILKLLPRKKNDSHYHDGGLKKVKAGDHVNDVQWL